MKIKLVSDIHLEFSDIDIPNNGADVLILSGDIMLAEALHKNSPEYLNNRFRGFLQRCSDNFKNVIYIAGNHEFYNGRFHASIDHLIDACLTFNNIHFLENNTKTIDDIVFMGGTIWTDLNKGDPLVLHSIQSMMNDYNIIRDDSLGYTKLRPANTALRNRKTVKFLQDCLLENRDKTCVVVGHHAPTNKSIHPKYAHDTIVNYAYCNNLENLILDNPQVKLWTCGHVHHSHRYYVGDTLVACNPRGYEGHEPDTGWSPDKLIDLDNMPTKDDVNNDFRWMNW